MWFATSPGEDRPCGGAYCLVAIPLRGYVVCNREGTFLEGRQRGPVAIPLRGYVVCNTTCSVASTPICTRVAIPLRGYVVCNLCRSCQKTTAPTRVAIPLRGYVVCNLDPPIANRLLHFESQSPYGAMWFATSINIQEMQYWLRSQSPYGAMWFATLPP